MKRRKTKLVLNYMVLIGFPNLLITTGKKCLLVEDIAVNQQIMREFVERQNMKVVSASNGLEGFYAFKVSILFI